MAGHGHRKECIETWAGLCLAARGIPLSPPAAPAPNPKFAQCPARGRSLARRPEERVGSWCCHDRPRLPGPFTSKAPVDLTLIHGICLGNTRAAQPRLWAALPRPGAAQAEAPGGWEAAGDVPRPRAGTERGPEPQKPNLSPPSPCTWDRRGARVTGRAGSRGKVGLVWEGAVDFPRGPRQVSRGKSHNL